MELRKKEIIETKINNQNVKEQRNWYVIQVFSGNEGLVQEYLEKWIDQITYQDIFIPRYDRLRNYRGVWHTKREVLFPGYLFIISDAVYQLYGQLRKIPELTKLIRSEETILPVTEEEVSFLLCLSNEEHIVEMSKGYMIGDRVIVTQGPLAEWKGVISKIDRHKRIAVLEANFFGRKMNVTVGLEIVKRE